MTYRPEDADDTVFIPNQHLLQKVFILNLSLQVTIGDKQRWRAIKNPTADLPEYLTDHMDMPHNYEVIVPKVKFFGPLDPTSSFLKKWDMLALGLLLFTASVTPYETA